MNTLQRPAPAPAVPPDFKVVIPARFGSTRLPGKPLLLIHGKPMIQHVVERARASAAGEVIVATDDQRIVTACAAFGAEAQLTGPTIAAAPTGSPRSSSAAPGPMTPSSSTCRATSPACRPP